MISKTAEYALRAIACLATQQSHLASADCLAEKTKVPRRYLNRVLQDLAGAGLVRSRPGPGGGYELLASTAEITILKVIDAVSPLERIRSCPLGLPSHQQLCPLHAELDKAYAATEAAFRDVTIEQLLNSANPSIPLCDLGTAKAEASAEGAPVS
ncbi:Rrf2 family transcriptional regulator [Bremerella cremea]|uniref:RrF2 family transcriptional regulator n=1 Tax=Bremerella cremea TaxID=1031537 RepID=UPI0031EB4FBA